MGEEETTHDALFGDVPDRALTDAMKEALED
jgi:hypothetical protein